MTEEAEDQYTKIKDEVVDPAIAMMAHGTRIYNENDTFLKDAVDEFIKYLDRLDRTQLVVVALIATQRAADLLVTFVEDKTVDKDTE